MTFTKFLIFTCGLSNDCSGGMENFWVSLVVLKSVQSVCLSLDKLGFEM